LEKDLEFYTRRAGEELRAAAAATTAEAQMRHRMLAEQYAIRVQEEANRPAEEA
jgi:hypothetical protein